MENKRPQIAVVNVRVAKNRLSVTYQISEELQPFFNDKGNEFWVEYSEEMDSVPIGIAVIPFVCNVLPIVWLTNAQLIVPELDKTFFDSINVFKQGYVKMYPMLDFLGDVATTSVDYSYQSNGGSAAFFSGGVDAFTTLIQHREEHPLLITLLGADVKLTDYEGLSILKEQTSQTAIDYNLPKPCFVLSNFRTFIHESNLSSMVVASNDGWWHGFQHGIGIISHAAPIAYLKRIKIVYIASSCVAGDTYTCASDPTIDNYVRFGATRIHHDQYNLCRQDKVGVIVKYVQDTNMKVPLRVCWITSGGKNCCHCEKCLRTMMALFAEGADPHDYNFNYTEEDLRNSERIVRNALYRALPSVIQNWVGTVERFKQTGAYKSNRSVNWIYHLDLYHPLSWISIKKMQVRWILKKVCNKCLA